MARSHPLTSNVSLVVDAHEDTRILYVEHFQRLGWEADGASDGAEGLSKALSNPPDLILTELRLPRIDGLQFIEIVKREPTTAAVSIIVVTTDDRTPLLERARRIGVDAVYTKPIEVPVLFAHIEELRRQRRELMANSAALTESAHRTIADANHILVRRARSHVRWGGIRRRRRRQPHRRLPARTAARGSNTNEATLVASTSISPNSGTTTIVRRAAGGSSIDSAPNGCGL